MKIYPTERQEAIAFMDWARYSLILNEHLIHIPNEGKRSRRTGNDLKRQGLRPGVADYFLSYPAGGYHGAWIELKRQVKSTISHHQLEFLDSKREVGYFTAVAYGANDAIYLVAKYLTQLERSDEGGILFGHLELIDDSYWVVK